MAKQSLLWTVLPNGLIDRGKGMRVSVVLSPRLEFASGELPRALELPPRMARLARGARSGDLRVHLRHGPARIRPDDADRRREQGRPDHGSGRLVSLDCALPPRPARPPRPIRRPHGRGHPLVARQPISPTSSPTSTARSRARRRRPADCQRRARCAGVGLARRRCSTASTSARLRPGHRAAATRGVSSRSIASTASRNASTPAGGQGEPASAARRARARQAC